MLDALFRMVPNVRTVHAGGDRLFYPNPSEAQAELSPDSTKCTAILEAVAAHLDLEELSLHGHDSFIFNTILNRYENFAL